MDHALGLGAGASGGGRLGQLGRAEEIALHIGDGAPCGASLIGANPTQQDLSLNRVDGIWLDGAMRSRLGLSLGTAEDFAIKKANWYQEFMWMWHTSDPMIRTAGRIALISFALGLIGLLLGIMPLFMRCE